MRVCRVGDFTGTSLSGWAYPSRDKVGSAAGGLSTTDGRNMPTRINFDKDHSVIVDEDLSAVEGALRQAAPSAFATVALTVKDSKVLINAALVRSAEERQTGKRTVRAIAG